MKRKLIIGVIALIWLSGCEDIYKPELEDTEPMLVVEACIMHGQSESHVRLSKTVNFNEAAVIYPTVNGASVTLTDDRNNNIVLQNSGPGMYKLTQPLDTGRQYKIVIASEGEVYESSFERVLKVPDIDTVYAEPWEELVEKGTDKAAGDLQKQSGARLFADIKGGNGNTFYRFSGQKICQYTYQFIEKVFGMEETMFCWKTIKPEGAFNVAAPPEYSQSFTISKHPLVFLESSYWVMVADTLTFFSGWIYICHQYALSRGSYQFYRDMNSQLTASGKIFDPMYTQARSNISCRTNSKKIVLGNFEISAVREHRFYVEYRGNNKYFLKKIPYFYKIPQIGKSPVFPPDWWEVRFKRYPGQE